jgi:hypothetical protein
LFKSVVAGTVTSVMALAIGPLFAVEFSSDLRSVNNAIANTTVSHVSERPVLGTAVTQFAQAGLRPSRRPATPGVPVRAPAVTATSNLPDLAPRIHPADPHRLSVGGATWYVAGYYPSVGALSTDQTDYTYYIRLIDNLAANGVNYFRVAFDMGQPFGDAMTVYQRTGGGVAQDGRPQFNLDQFNQEYFDYWRAVVDYAQANGVAIQLCMTDGWHTTAPVVEDDGPTRVWGLLYDYYYSGNNINGVNVTSRDDLMDPSNPVRAYQQALMRKIVDTLGDYPNIIWEIGNETGNTAWEVDMAEYVTRYESSRNTYRHLVVPRDLPGHQFVPGQCDNDPANTHAALAAAFQQNLVLITDNDCVGPDTPDVRRRKAWAALTAGAQIDFFHFAITDPNVLASDDAQKGMAYIGLQRKFLVDVGVDLAGMVPLDRAVTNGWALGRPGAEYVIYLPNGGDTSVPGLLAPQRAVWFNPRDGEWSYAGAGPQYTAPDSDDWVLYLVQ